MSKDFKLNSEIQEEDNSDRDPDDLKLEKIPEYVPGNSDTSELEVGRHGRPLANRFDRDARNRFLSHYSKTGRVYESCRMAGVSEETVNTYKRANKLNFEAEYAEAKGVFRDSIEAEIQRRAMTGIDEPIIGGQYKDEVVAVIKRYSDKLLEMLAKRHIAEYRNQGQLDVAVTGGVMVIPVRPKADEDWGAEYENLEKPIMTDD